uniref:ORF44 n=1 Tax=Malaco herpesvirus 4 TaxID=3031800 RepID=A0AA48SF21_9VIRU|nr:TPA_asm: ORF44 [Malaco herpesvirus 4]
MPNPLPITKIGIVGVAGAGKTTSSAAHIIRHPDVSVSGSTNQCIANLRSVANDMGRDNTFDVVSGTLVPTTFQMLNIRFRRDDVQTMLGDTLLDEDVQKSYRDLTRVGGEFMNNAMQFDQASVNKLYREHKCTAYKELYPLYKSCLDEFIKEFEMDGDHLRLHITDEAHAFCQPPSMYFPEVSRFIAKRSGKDRRRPYRPPDFLVKNSIQNQGQFMRLLIGNINKLTYSKRYRFKNNNNPSRTSGVGKLCNHLFIKNQHLIEEAGKNAEVLLDLYELLIWRVALMVNSPLVHTEIPTLFLSGSWTQSKVIDFKSSMLNALNAVTLQCKSDNLCFVSEFIRRRDNDFEDPYSNMIKTLRTRMEKSFGLNELSYSPLLLNEIDPVKIMDCNFNQSALRMFQLHESTQKYNEHMYKVGKATVGTLDLIHVSNRLIDLDLESVKTRFPAEMETLNNYPHGTINCGLSVLTQDEALNNLVNFWMEVYDEYCDTTLTNTADASLIADIPAYEAVQKNESDVTSREAFVDGLGDGFDAQREAYYMKVHELRNALHEKRKEHKRRAKQEIETVEGLTPQPPGDAQQNDVEGEAPKQKTIVKLPTIVVPAHLVLSANEHARARFYCRSIQDHLTKSRAFGREVYTSAAAQNQKGDVHYLPQYDLVEMKAWPIFHLLNDLSTDSEDPGIEYFARSLFMRCASFEVFLTFGRDRYIVPQTNVLNVSVDTPVRPIGVRGTLCDILTSQSFYELTGTYFRVCIYSRVVCEYQRWLYTRTCSKPTDMMSYDDMSFIDIHNSDRWEHVSIKARLDPVARDVLDRYASMWVERADNIRSARCVSKELPQQQQQQQQKHKPERTEQHIHDALYQLVNVISSNMMNKDFIDNHFMILRAHEDSLYYKSMRYGIHRSHADLRMGTLPGEMQLLGSGYSSHVMDAPDTNRDLANKAHMCPTKTTLHRYSNGVTDADGKVSKSRPTTKQTHSVRRVTFRNNDVNASVRMTKQASTLNEAFLTYYPELIKATTTRLLVKQVVEVDTLPIVENGVKWFDLFCSKKGNSVIAVKRRKKCDGDCDGDCTRDKKRCKRTDSDEPDEDMSCENNNIQNLDRFALITRRNMPNFNAPESMCYHHSFYEPFGAGMNYPMPFVPRSKSTKTNIIAKTPFTIYPLGDDEHDSNVMSHKTMGDLSFKKHDRHAVFTTVNKIFPNSCVTYDAMQGLDTDVTTYLDLERSDPDTMLLILSRNKKAQNVFVSNLDSAQRRLLAPETVKPVGGGGKARQSDLLMYNNKTALSLRRQAQNVMGQFVIYR